MATSTAPSRSRAPLGESSPGFEWTAAPAPAAATRSATRHFEPTTIPTLAPAHEDPNARRAGPDPIRMAAVWLWGLVIALAIWSLFSGDPA